jgi:hypothetical protein
VEITLADQIKTTGQDKKQLQKTYLDYFNAAEISKRYDYIFSGIETAQENYKLLIEEIRQDITEKKAIPKRVLSDLSNTAKVEMQPQKVPFEIYSNNTAYNGKHTNRIANKKRDAYTPRRMWLPCAVVIAGAMTVSALASAYVTEKINTNENNTQVHALEYQLAQSRQQAQTIQQALQQTRQSQTTQELSHSENITCPVCPQENTLRDTQSENCPATNIITDTNILNNRLQSNLNECYEQRDQYQHQLQMCNRERVHLERSIINIERTR